MLNDITSAASLAATRRSGKPRDMIAPGPDTEQLRRILTAAIRVPDHGKIAPWRLLVIEPEDRPEFAALLRRAYLVDRPAASESELANVDQFAMQAPTLVIVLSAPVAGSPIPLWEQELSAGALCMNLLSATHAEGFVGGWLTGWPAFSPAVVDGLGYPGTRVAGFLFLGTAPQEPAERPRPDFDQIVSRWPVRQTP